MVLDAALTSMPSSENSAQFWLIGRSCPLHKAHPFGAKLNAIMQMADP
jgi:hypothetical protein